MKVHNRHHGTAPPGAVYIGRGTLWGNHFEIGKDGTRDEVCDKHIDYLVRNPWLVKLVKRRLRGKDLVCSCSPRRCHGDHLLNVANS